MVGKGLKVNQYLAETEMPMVVVTHEMGFTKEIADRVIFMDTEFTVEEGTWEQVLNHPQHERIKNFWIFLIKNRQFNG